MRDDAYDDKDKIFKPQPGPQTAFIESKADIAIYGGSAGSGKLLILKEKVQTPTGEVEIQDVKVGDKIFNPDGNTQDILQIHHHKNVNIYKVSFNDGTFVKACEDHLWNTWKAGIRTNKAIKLIKSGTPDPVFSLYPLSAEVMRTKDIKDNWLSKGIKPLIPCTKPLDYKIKSNLLKIDPYLLGILIGDGCFSDKSMVRSKRIRICKPDKEILEYPSKVGFSTEIIPPSGSKCPYVEFKRDKKDAELREDLVKCGLFGTYSHSKFIPEEFFTRPLKDRLSLVQGIFDTDGTCAEKESNITWTTVSEKLSEGVVKLVQSLGGWVSVSTEEAGVNPNRKHKRDCQKLYKHYVKLPVECPPFRMKRKLSKYRKPTRRLYRTIVSIEFDHIGEGKCLTVSNPNGLFITTNFIVTHNSFAILLESLRNINIPNFYTMILRRTSNEVLGPGSLWDESHNIYPHFEGESFVTRRTWKFPTGAKTQFAFIELEKDLERFKGTQAPLIMFDELTTFSERMFFYMLSRNRSTTGIPGYIRATTNPEEGWVRKLIAWWLDDTGYPIPYRSGVIRWFVRIEGEMFWADKPEELIEMFPGQRVLPKSLTFIPAKLSDNKKMMDKDPGYESSLMAMSRVDRLKLLDGCWLAQATFGSYFERSWCDLVMMPDEPGRWVRYWDRASSEPSETYPNPDYTAGVLMGIGKQTGSFYIKDVVRFRAKPMKVHAEIRKTAEKDKKLYGNVRVVIEKDPGQAGASDAHYLVNHLKGFEVRVRSATKDKLTRFLPFSAAAENGLIKVCRGEWNEAFLAELERFIGDGVGKDDQVDGASGGFNELLSKAYSAPNLVMPDLSFKGLGISSNVRF
jgi:predicted phage terminase large subunit-like protein